MPDQFCEVKPGEHLPGLPTRPWNKLLGLVKPNLAGAGLEGALTTGVEVLVANNTAAALDVYGILGLDMVNDFAADPDYWRGRDLFAGGTPAAGSVVAVVMQGLAVGEVGRARLAGRIACKVDVTDVNHLYAVPTNSSDHLVSAASGPIRILGLENDWGATGVQWAVVILVGVAPAGFARFSLVADLSTAQASQANCLVDSSWGVTIPGIPPKITVYNLPTHTTGAYVFSGANGNKGLATYDPPANKWWIVQLECNTQGAGGGGGCGGFTGTIGD